MTSSAPRFSKNYRGFMTGPKRLSVIFISLAASGLLATAGCAGSGSTVAPVQPTQSVPIAPSVRPLSADQNFDCHAERGSQRQRRVPRDPGQRFAMPSECRRLWLGTIIRLARSATFARRRAVTSASTGRPITSNPNIRITHTPVNFHNSRSTQRSCRARRLLFSLSGA